MAVASSNKPEIITLDQWQGINQSASRGLIDDNELHWLENFFPTAPGQLRAGFGPSAPIYTAPYGVPIRRIFATCIDGTNPLLFAFLNDGTVTEININTGAQIGLGQIWQPVAPEFWCDLKLWAPRQFGHTAGQSGGVVIGSPQGLYAWDGATLTIPGQAPPLWLTGGATTDSSGNALAMPSGLPGIYAMEVYQQRLWIMGQTVISFSAASNGADFSTGSGGGSFGYFGDKLTVTRTDLAASGGFLYLFNDSSIDVVGNIQLVGQTIPGQAGTITTYTTAFQLSNVDPQNGQRFYSPVGHWGNAFTLWNGAGLYGFQGQNTQLISQKIITLFHSLDAAAFNPTMCPCDIHGRRWMLFLGNFKDPWNIHRSLMLCWDGQIWVTASQGLELTQITSREQNSCIEAFGTDGNVIVRLFAQPDPLLPKRVSTKAYKGVPTLGGMHLLTIKHWKRIYMEMRDNMHPPGPEGVSVYGTMATADGGIVNGREEIGFEVQPGGFGTIPASTVGAGISAWIDLMSLSPDFVLERLSLTYDERSLFGA